MNITSGRNIFYLSFYVKIYFQDRFYLCKRSLIERLTKPGLLQSCYILTEEIFYYLFALIF